MKHFVVEHYFEIIHDVNEIWEHVRKIDNYRQVMGVELFTRMFEIAPGVWDQFPWEDDITGKDALEHNPQFAAFAESFMTMLDLAIDMLGPDLDMVEAELQDLGVRHIKYGVMPKHYPLMGRALLDTLTKKLDEDAFDRRHQEAWNAIYTFMSVSMMQGAFDRLVKVDAENAKLKKEIEDHKRSIEKMERRASIRSVDSTERSEASFPPMVTTISPRGGQKNGAFGAILSLMRNKQRA